MWGRKSSKRRSPVVIPENPVEGNSNGTQSQRNSSTSVDQQQPKLKRPKSSPTLSSFREHPPPKPERSLSASNIRRNKPTIAQKKDSVFVDLLFEAVEHGTVKLPRSLRQLENSEEESDLVSRLRSVSSARNKASGPSFADRLLFAKLREVVSKKKRRYKVDTFNLDLSYITDKIIAMGFPSEEREGFYRNPMDQVVRFLETKHANHYRVYNLCSEPNRKYDTSKFVTGQVLEMGFEDHNAPPFLLIDEFCSDAQNWLNKSPENVVAAHCKAGKGRTGTLICCLFLKLREFDCAADALAFYGLMRTTNNKGVTIPSQIRYVHYYDNRDKKDAKKPPSLIVESIFFSHPPKIPSTELYFIVRTDGKEIDSRTFIPAQSISASKAFTFQFPSDSNFAIKGDAKFVFSYGKNSDTLCQFWINTTFIENNSLTLSKFEIDKIHKDKKHQIVPQNFFVEIKFINVS